MSDLQHMSKGVDDAMEVEVNFVVVWQFYFRKTAIYWSHGYYIWIYNVVDWHVQIREKLAPLRKEAFEMIEELEQRELSEVSSSQIFEPL